MPEGKQWSELKPIGDYGGIVAVGCLERLHDGRHLALFHDDGRFIVKDGERGPFYVYKIISDDGGLNWSKPTVIASHSQAAVVRARIVPLA